MNDEDRMTPEWLEGCPACRLGGPMHWDRCSMVVWQSPMPETIPTPPQYERERVARWPSCSS